MDSSFSSAVTASVVRSPASSAILLLVLGGCGSGRIETVETADASDDSPIDDTPPDDTSDTEVEVGPCGAGRPATCVAVVDGVCLFADIPARLGGDEPLPPGDELSVTPSHPEPCGLYATLACGEHVAQVVVQEEGAPAEGGWPDPFENGAWWVHVWHAETRVRLGVAEIHGPPSAGGCPLAYYGDAAGLPCVQQAFTFVRARYDGCGFTQSCERCQCRHNDFAPLPECAAPPE